MTTEKGGRPRALTLEQIRQQKPPEARNNEKEVKDSLATNSLTELKRLWCSHKSNGSQKIAKAGGSYQELPLPRRVKGNCSTIISPKNAGGKA